MLGLTFIAIILNVMTLQLIFIKHLQKPFINVLLNSNIKHQLPLEDWHRVFKLHYLFAGEVNYKHYNNP